MRGSELAGSTNVEVENNERSIAVQTLDQFYKTHMTLMTAESCDGPLKPAVIWTETARVMASDRNDPLAVLALAAGDGEENNKGCAIAHLVRDTGNPVEKATSLCINRIEADHAASGVDKAEALDIVRRAARELSNCLRAHTFVEGQGIRCPAPERSEVHLCCNSQARPTTRRLLSLVNICKMAAFSYDATAGQYPRKQSNGELHGTAFRAGGTGLCTLQMRLINLLNVHAKGAPHTSKKIWKGKFPRWKALELEYRHSELGAALVRAGFLRYSREYAIGPDPFKEAKIVRSLAFCGAGPVADDASCYPHALAHLLEARLSSVGPSPPRSTSATKVLVQNKAAIFDAMSKRGELNLGDRANDILKRLFLRLSMDGSFSMFMQEHGIDGCLAQALEANLDFPGEIEASDGSRIRFSLAAYITEQRQLTTRLAELQPGMLNFIRDWFKLRRDPRVLTPERTLKSYVLQSFEGLSREAKVREALRFKETDGGVTVVPINLQHDGIQFAMSGDQELDREVTAALQGRLEQATKAALEYDQPVTCEPTNDASLARLKKVYTKRHKRSRPGRS